MDSKEKFHFIHKSQGDRAKRDLGHISQSSPKKQNQQKMWGGRERERERF